MDKQPLLPQTFEEYVTKEAQEIIKLSIILPEETAIKIIKNRLLMFIGSYMAYAFQEANFNINPEKIDMVMIKEGFLLAEKVGGMNDNKNS